MTAISAPNSLNQAPDEPVQQIAQRLSVAVPVRMWGPMSSFLLSICTLGLLPLLVWPRRWNAYAEFERRQMISLASWWRGRATPMQAQAMDASISQIGPQSIFTVVPILILVFTGMMVVSLLNDGRSLDAILGLTMGYRRYHWWFLNPLEMNLHVIWIVSLLIGYIFYWAGVRSHALGVEALAMKINEIAGPRRSRVFVPVASGLNPVWIVAAVVMCGMHGWWGIPLVLAGAMQRKYVTSTSPRIRQTLVEQLLDRPVERTSYCNTPGCGAPKRDRAKFCPRCGVKV
jgi:hypothetical protein